MQVVEHPPQHLLTVAEYMTLDTVDRTELLDGVIYDVSPRNEPHRHAVRFLSEQLTRGLPHEWMVQTQDAVAVPDWHGNDAPEVDIAIIRRRRYDPIATSGDAAAFIEVSHTTYAYDRKRKIPLYVKAGVPAWIVHVALRQVEFYGSTIDLESEHGQVFSAGETLNILGVAIAVSNLF